MKLAHRGMYVSTQMKRTYCTEKVVVSEYPVRRNNGKKTNPSAEGVSSYTVREEADRQAGGQVVKDLC